MRNIKKTLFIGAIYIFSSIVALQASALDFYIDGVHDAYSQIIKDIKRGSASKNMKEYKGQYLVIKDINSDPTVNIVLYKTIGTKLGFAPETVRRKRGQRDLIVFDFFDRKGDAVSAQKKLSSNGIKTFIKKSTNKVEYVRNPILTKKIQKYIRKDTKKKIKPKKSKMTQKVKKVKKGDSNYKFKNKKSNISIIPLMYPGKMKVKQNTNNKISKRKMERKSKRSSFKRYLAIKRNFCEDGRIDKGAIVIDGRRTIVGKKINDLMIEKIKKAKYGYKAFLVDENGVHYRLNESFCSQRKHKMTKAVRQPKRKPLRSTKKEDKKPKKQTLNTPKPKDKSLEKAQINKMPKEDGETNSNRYLGKYICDFKKIKVAKNKFKNPIRISDTPYSELKTKVMVKQENNLFSVRMPGADKIYLNDQYFHRACSNKD